MLALNEDSVFLYAKIFAGMNIKDKLNLEDLKSVIEKFTNSYFKKDLRKKIKILE